MAEVQYTDLPDTQKQQIRDEVPLIKEYNCPTYDSFNSSTQTITGGQQGYQLAFFVSDYGQNSYLAPGPSGNSYVQPIAPTSESMWVGLAFPGKAMYTDGIFMDTMDTKASLIKNAQLRRLAIMNYMKHMNYYAIGDGTGTLAVVTSVAGGTFTGTTAAQTTPNQTKGAHRLLKNVTYDVVDESSFAVVGTITPSMDGIFSATVPVTSTGLPNNAGAFVVEQGAYNKVPRGLAYLINNADRVFQGLDTADFSEFNSSFVDLNGSALTSATINTLKTKVQIRINTGSKDGEFARICHTTPGQFQTLASGGFGARQYQAADGQATTTYGYPRKYEDGDTMWVIDADIDEDRVYLRRSSDFFLFELSPFGPSNRDGLSLRQAPGDNGVGSEAWFEQVKHFFNFGFDGDGSPNAGSGASAYVVRAQVVNSQVNVLS